MEEKENEIRLSRHKSRTSKSNYGFMGRPEGSRDMKLNRQGANLARLKPRKQSKRRRAEHSGVGQRLGLWLMNGGKGFKEKVHGRHSALLVKNSTPFRGPQRRRGKEINPSL